MPETDPAFAARIAALAEPGAWPSPVAAHPASDAGIRSSGPSDVPIATDRVEVIHTHISVVFLVADRAYKLKKPLDLGFLDFRTLDQRKRACEAEVALNRRFATGVYVGVVPVVVEAGAVRVDRPGAPVDWLVQMVRLSESDTLLAAVEAGRADEALVRRVGRRIAALHGAAAGGTDVEAMASLATVAGNARENFAQSASHVGDAVHPAVWARVRDLTEAALTRLGPTITARVPLARDTHGDLRLEHVYLRGDRDEDVVLVDCIEFNDRFRWSDPASDLAFLVMDLAVRGERALADALVDAWLVATGDGGARDVLAFYVAYRSVIRAKVAGFQLAEPEIPEALRRRALDRARRHWLFALGELASPADRPVLLGVGGLPGTGKSTLAFGLAEHAGFDVIRSDVVRKELAGLPLDEHPARVGYETGLYAPGRKDAVYAVCLDRAREALLAGGRVIVDASFSRESWREDLLALGRELGVPARLVWCEADPEVVHRRLDARRGDPSDADWSVYQGAAARWEPLGARTAAASIHVDAGTSAAVTIAGGVQALRQAGLAG